MARALSATGPWSLRLSMRDGTGGSREKSTSAWTCAVAGVVLSLALHAYYVATWPRYVESISDVRMAQRGGVPPTPHIGATTRSARDGSVVFLFRVSPWRWSRGGS